MTSWHLTATSITTNYFFFSETFRENYCFIKTFGSFLPRTPHFMSIKYCCTNLCKIWLTWKVWYKQIIFLLHWRTHLCIKIKNEKSNMIRQLLRTHYIYNYEPQRHFGDLQQRKHQNHACGIKLTSLFHICQYISFIICICIQNCRCNSV